MSTDTSVDSFALTAVPSIDLTNQTASQNVVVPPSTILDMSLANSSPLDSYVEQSSDISSSISKSDMDTRSQVDGDSESVSGSEVDPQILEALRSTKDRLYVLKLGEQMEALIQERNSRTKFDLQPDTSYQRLLVHRCAAYYKLTPENEPTTRGISVFVTLDSRLPPRRFSDLVPYEETSLPKFQIMRRSGQARRRSKQSGSYPGSSAGDDGEGSDPEPSESGSMGSRSTTSKKHMTIAEREAAYQEARTRIFMDYEEKGKNKEKNGSASSSSLSVASVSGSTSNQGSVDGYEEYVNPSYTENDDWSDGITRDNPHGRRGGYGSSSVGTSRNFRNNNSFNAFGAGSARGSGTSSPAITFPNIYEQPQAPYDPSQGYPPPPLPGGYMAPFPMYPYAPPGQAPPQPYLPPYPYYHQHFPYPPASFPPNQSTSSDSISPSSSPADMYQQQPYNQMQFAPPYMWPHTSPPPFNPPHGPPAHSPPQMENQPNLQQMQGPPPQAVPNPAYPLPPPTQYPNAPYGPYMPPPPVPYNYAVPPFYGQQPYHMPPPAPSQSQPSFHAEVLPQNEPHGGNDYNAGQPHVNGNTPRSPVRDGPSNNNLEGNPSRPSAPVARSAWSYGPGVGGMGNLMNVPHYTPSGDNVGPRFNSTARRTSGASSGSGGGNRPIADETSSTTSSSTSSSSSRRTFTSTSTSSKHPLPPRPDWAAGLMPQSQSRHRHSNHGSRNMSPARSPNRQPLQQLPPIHLQSTDFPPLSMSNSPGKRNSPGGAWNTQGHRPALSPSPIDHPAGVSHGNALINHHGNGNGNAAGRPNDDRGFERPPPKPNAELFNPNNTSISHSQSPSPSTQEKADRDRADKERSRKDAIANSILVDNMGSLKLQGSNFGKRPDNIEGEHAAKDVSNSRVNGNDAKNLRPSILPITKDVSTGSMITS